MSRAALSFGSPLRKIASDVLHRMQGASGAAHDAYICQPCTVDPRPEGALLYEGVDPRGPKGK